MDSDIKNVLDLHTQQQVTIVAHNNHLIETSSAFVKPLINFFKFSSDHLTPFCLHYCPESFLDNSDTGCSIAKTAKALDATLEAIQNAVAEEEFVVFDDTVKIIDTDLPNKTPETVILYQEQELCYKKTL